MGGGLSMCHMIRWHILDYFMLNEKSNEIVFHSYDYIVQDSAIASRMPNHFEEVSCHIVRGSCS